MIAVEELAQTLRSLAAAFLTLECDWVVGGSLASAAYGEPRATNDIDTVACLTEAQARGLGDALGPHFYVPQEAALDAVRRRDCFNVIDERSYMKVHIFVPAPGPLGEGQLDRRRVLELMKGVEVPVLGPEDIVLQKLRWYRMGGGSSDRQWRDSNRCVASARRQLHGGGRERLRAGRVAHPGAEGSRRNVVHAGCR